MSTDTQTIWGYIASNGTKLTGDGFQATQIGTGEYNVIFDDQFVSNIPCILLTGVSGSTDPDSAGCIATSVVTPTNKSFYVRLKGAANGEYIDRDFSFVAMG